MKGVVARQTMNPARLVFGFLLGIMTIAFLAVVTENWVVVATVGIVHLVGFVVLSLLFLKQLEAENRRDAARDADDLRRERESARAAQR